MLPASLAERLAPHAPPPRERGRFVLYWMRAALRAFDNPSLDVALSLARRLDAPAFVYLGLSSHPGTSDRQHAFFLESALDVLQALAERGVGGALHLERRGFIEPRLLALAAEAKLVVTDFTPLTSSPDAEEAVARAAPLWRVDASCVAPSFALPAPASDLASFSAAARPLWDQALASPWRDEAPSHPPFLPELPFAPVPPDADVADLVAECEVDHAVARVHDTPGGTAAGEARWKAFLEERLDAYAQHRSNPLAGGTSRMSAYLRLGCVSPFRLARDVRARPGDGPARYLEELLGWRELAFGFCRSVPDTRSADALPDWARATLKAHQGDRRAFFPSFEELARAQTGEPAWDVCQRLLMTHGELHTTLRVPWAKALVGWTRTADEALARLLELNDRFSLDGGDPLSRFGVLWCLGAFDAPQAERAVLGTVRASPLADLPKKVDLAELTRRSLRPARRRALSVAVVGAGVAGAAAARVLVDAGQAVTVFEAQPTPGGRLVPLVFGPHHLDALELEVDARDERFRRWVRAFEHERLLVEWTPSTVRFGEHLTPLPPARRLVSVPTMGALADRLLHGVDVRLSAPVREASRTDGRWRLGGREGAALGEFDALVLAAPADEAARLVDASSWTLGARLREVRTEPAWLVGLELAEPCGLELDLGELATGPLERVVRDASRPGRPPGERWLLRARGDWSLRHEREAPEAVGRALLDVFSAATGARAAAPSWLAAHLVRDAAVSRALGEACLAERELVVVACGGYCLGGGLEAAFLSGSAAGGRLAGWPEETADEKPSPARTAQLALW